MATLTTKYSVGDVVYHAWTTTERKQHPCPDCMGARKWKASSPAGGEYEFACPRCAASYRSNHEMSLDYSAFTPFAQRLTIGSVRVDTGSQDRPVEYMCCETGVGSGSIYAETRLFETEAEALSEAQAMADDQNAKVKWVVQQFNDSLAVSDYQLDSAALKQAAEAKSRASSMLWNLSDLFEQINDASDKEEILEAVEDYKTYRWDRDKKALAEAEAQS